MTTEDKAREFANERKCSGLGMPYYKHNSDKYEGYLAGHNSRDAEVSELLSQIQQLALENRHAHEVEIPELIEQLREATEWQDISTAPVNIPILVKGGRFCSELNEEGYMCFEPHVVILKNETFNVLGGIYYETWINEPTYWRKI